MTSILTTGTLLKMALELTLGVCMKLYCDNGRVHYEDFVNDFLFWVPGVEARDGDGLTRSIADLREPVLEDALPTPAAHAAK